MGGVAMRRNSRPALNDLYRGCRQFAANCGAARSTFELRPNRHTDGVSPGSGTPPFIRANSATTLPSPRVKRSPHVRQNTDPGAMGR
jgi:hypothetical protein